MWCCFFFALHVHINAPTNSFCSSVRDAHNVSRMSPIPRFARKSTYRHCRLLSLACCMHCSWTLTCLISLKTTQLKMDNQHELQAQKFTIIVNVPILEAETKSTCAGSYKPTRKRRKHERSPNPHRHNRGA